MKEIERNEPNPTSQNQELKRYFDLLPEIPEDSVIFSGKFLDQETFSNKFWQEFGDMKRREKSEYTIAVAGRLRDHLKKSKTTSAFQEFLVERYKQMFTRQVTHDDDSVYTFTCRTLQLDREESGGIFDPKETFQIESTFLGVETSDIYDIAQSNENISLAKIDSGIYDELRDSLKKRCLFTDRWAMELFEGVI